MRRARSTRFAARILGRVQGLVFFGFFAIGFCIGILATRHSFLFQTAALVLNSL
jgi:hypothetical protein